MRLLVVRCFFPRAGVAVGVDADDDVVGGGSSSGGGGGGGGGSGR